jgi:hypothetical protein
MTNCRRARVRAVRTYLASAIGPVRQGRLALRLLLEVAVARTLMAGRRSRVTDRLLSLRSSHAASVAIAQSVWAPALAGRAAYRPPSLSETAGRQQRLEERNSVPAINLRFEAAPALVLAFESIKARCHFLCLIDSSQIFEKESRHRNFAGPNRARQLPPVSSIKLPLPVACRTRCEREPKWVPRLP